MSGVKKQFRTPKIQAGLGPACASILEAQETRKAFRQTREAVQRESDRLLQIAIRRPNGVLSLASIGVPRRALYHWQCGETRLPPKWHAVVAKALA
jgi:hypothetical protein